jgi:hypothetical protein
MLSRFQISPDKPAVFLDSSTSSLLVGEAPVSSFTLIDNTTFAAHPRFGDDLFYTGNQDGEPLRGYGSLWSPTTSGGIAAMDVSLYNNISIISLGRNEVAVAWITRPVIEKWHLADSTSATRELDLPETRAIGRRDLGDKPDGAMSNYISGIFCTQEYASLFCMIPYTTRSKVIYELSPDTLNPLRRFTLTIEKPLLIRSLVANQTQDSIEFWGLDFRNGVVVHLSY